MAAALALISLTENTQAASGAHPNLNGLQLFLHAVGRAFVQRDPAHLTQEFYKADRGGRILVDTGRNEFGATYAAAYAVRPKPNAPISAPCTWEEVDSGKAKPRTFTLRGMAARLDAVGELWSGLARQPHALPAPP